MEKFVLNSLNEKIVITENSYFVTATDKILSGWGRAEGRICKSVFICDNYRQAQRLADALKNNPNSGFNFVNWSHKMPYYNAKRYKVCFRSYQEFNHDMWMKYTYIPEL